jgi:hypothetical protein
LASCWQVARRRRFVFFARWIAQCDEAAKSIAIAMATADRSGQVAHGLAHSTPLLFFSGATLFTFQWVQQTGRSPETNLQWLSDLAPGYIKNGDCDGLNRST